MKTILAIGLVILGLGIGFVARDFELFGLQFRSRDNDAGGSAVVVCFIGMLLIALPALFTFWASRRWRAYVATSRAFVGDFLEGRALLEKAPRRPSMIVAQDCDFTTAHALEPEDIHEILDEKVPERITALLDSSGEEITLLGQTVVGIYTARDELGGRLEPTWVIDRVWSDGRMTTEWVYVGSAGTRLRYIAGAEAFGHVPWRSATYSRLIVHVVLPPVTLVTVGILLSAHGSSVVLLGVALLPVIFYFAKWILSEFINPGAQVHERADPLTAFRDKAIESESRAAKDRACQAVHMLEPMGGSLR